MGFSRITPDPEKKILQAYTGRNQISLVKILAPWAKGAQNGDEKVHVFVTGTIPLMR